jgi:hypothetical protein
LPTNNDENRGPFDCYYALLREFSSVFPYRIQGDSVCVGCFNFNDKLLTERRNPHTVEANSISRPAVSPWLDLESEPPADFVYEILERKTTVFKFPGQALFGVTANEIGGNLRQVGAELL